jgi:hypothetical protein
VVDVLDALAQILLCGAFALAFRWGLHRTDSLGRPNRFPAVALALLLVPALLVGRPGVERRLEQRQLASAASELVGVKVSVHCQTAGEAFVDAGAELGYVKYDVDGVPEHKTLIKQGPCHDLRAYLHSSKAHPSADQILAVHILTHESMHMAGITNEARAECAAVQRDARMAELLGADPAEAHELARAYWVSVYPRMADDYVSGDCHAGGRLDERLPDPPWA